MADDRFLSRWSRRKLAEKQREDVPAPEVLEETESSAQAVDAPDGPSVPAESADRQDAEPERHPAEDIDIESLTKDSDFTVFMQKGVPSLVRRKALRKLWTSDPVLANLDGLNDYEDMEWTYGISDAATTDWKLGRGFLTDKDLGLEDDTESTEGMVEAEHTGEPVAEVSAEEDAPADEDGAVAEAAGAEAPEEVPPAEAGPVEPEPDMVPVSEADPTKTA